MSKAQASAFICRHAAAEPELVRDLAQDEGVVIVCGRYEGLDQRVIDHHQLMEVSVDYIYQVAAGGSNFA